MDPHEAAMNSHREGDDEDRFNNSPQHSHFLQQQWQPFTAAASSSAGTPRDTRGVGAHLVDSARRGVPHQPPFVQQHQQQQQHVAGDELFAASDPRGSHKRLMDIKQSAARDKASLLHRIEELGATVRELQVALAAAEQTVALYHQRFGSLDEFSSRQVHLREEALSLRDAVRTWQEREAAARARVRQLERVVDGLRRRGEHSSATEKLRDLQERLSFAYLQRHEAMEDVRRVEALAAQQAHHLALTTHAVDPGSDAGAGIAVADGATHVAAWRLRGKLADLRMTIKARDGVIASLESAIAGLQSVADSDGVDSIGEVNRRCPGCGTPQWSSPFCPTTGHRHLGYESDPVEAALASGEWTQLVAVGSFDVSYEHQPSGRIVTDLAAELVQQKRVKNKALASVASGGGSEQTTSALTAVTTAMDQPFTARPPLANEVRLLIDQLRMKNMEVAKLKGLLRAVAQSGMIGIPVAPAPKLSPSPVDGAAKEEAPKPLIALSSAVALGSPSRSAFAGGEETGLTAVENFDRDAETHARMAKLEQDNAMLSRRCVELIMRLADRDEAGKGGRTTPGGGAKQRSVT